MPSCVIKYCTINSTYQNKASGISFHKFPTDTAWKEYWTKAVRANRKDDEWRPTKFSVICSLHFEELDFYTTKAGYRRIKESAIPKKVRLVNSEWCLSEEASGSSSILTLRRVDETNYSCAFQLKSPLGPNTDEPCDCEVCNPQIEVSPADVFGETSEKRTEKEDKQQDISKPQDIILKPQDIISKRQNIISKPQDIISKPQDIISKPQDIISKPQDIISKPQDIISKPQDINSNYQRDTRDCNLEPILPKQKKKIRQPVKRHKLRNKSHARIMRKLNVLKRKARH